MTVYHSGENRKKIYSKRSSESKVTWSFTVLALVFKSQTGGTTDTGRLFQSFPAGGSKNEDAG